MAIPLSALRRALAEMAEGASFGARQAYGGPHIDQGMALGGIPGAIGGGAIGASVDNDDTYRTNGPGAGMVLGAGAGMLLGGGAGGMAKLAQMAVRGVGGGGEGFTRGLREALAEQAASRGMGRRAVREAADAEDGARFFSGFRTVPRSLDDVGPEEVALAAAGTGLGVLGGGGLLAITGGMAAQYQRAQRATGIEDLSMMTPEELSVLGHPELERDPELQAEAQQILMRHRKEVR